MNLQAIMIHMVSRYWKPLRQRLINDSSNSTTAYADIPVYGHFNCIHKWSLNISSLNTINSRTTVEFPTWRELFHLNKVVVGIQDRFVKFPMGFYGFDNFGRSYKNGVVVGRSVKLPMDFYGLQYFTIVYNQKNGILTQMVSRSMNQTIDGINKHCNYKLSITIYGKSNVVWVSYGVKKTSKLVVICAYVSRIICPKRLSIEANLEQSRRQICEVLQSKCMKQRQDALNIQLKGSLQTKNTLRKQLDDCFIEKNEQSQKCELSIIFDKHLELKLKASSRGERDLWCRVLKHDYNNNVNNNENDN
eukprot:177859_1